MTTPTDDPGAALLSAGKVAAMFGVDPKTVTRWANDGRLPCVRTLGGHRRFRTDVVRAALADLQGSDDQ